MKLLHSRWSSLGFVALGAITLLSGCSKVGCDETSGGCERERLAAKNAESRKAFFYEHVAPALTENGCVTCHATGYVEPIFSYEGYRPLLGMGRSSTDNYLIRKISSRIDNGRGAPAHIGGVRCASLDAEPCASIQAWWRVEFSKETGS